MGKQELGHVPSGIPVHTSAGAWTVGGSAPWEEAPVGATWGVHPAQATLGTSVCPLQASALGHDGHRQQPLCPAALTHGK